MLRKMLCLMGMGVAKFGLAVCTICLFIYVKLQLMPLWIMVAWGMVVFMFLNDVMVEEYARLWDGGGV